MNRLMRRGAVGAHEVDMRRQILHNVFLNAAADHAHVFLTFNLQVEQGRHEAALAQAGQQLVVVEVQRDRLFAVAIDDTGHHALTACCASGPLARPRAHRGFESFDLFGHCYLQLVKLRAPSKGVGP